MFLVLYPCLLWAARVYCVWVICKVCGCSTYFCPKNDDIAGGATSFAQNKSLVSSEHDFNMLKILLAIAVLCPALLPLLSIIFLTGIAAILSLEDGHEQSSFVQSERISPAEHNIFVKCLLLLGLVPCFFWATLVYFVLVVCQFFGCSTYFYSKNEEIEGDATSFVENKNKRAVPAERHYDNFYVDGDGDMIITSWKLWFILKAGVMMAVYYPLLVPVSILIGIGAIFVFYLTMLGLPPCVVWAGSIYYVYLIYKVFGAILSRAFDDSDEESSFVESVRNFPADVTSFAENKEVAPAETDFNMLKILLTICVLCPPLLPVLFVIFLIGIGGILSHSLEGIENESSFVQQEGSLPAEYHIFVKCVLVLGLAFPALVPMILFALFSVVVFEFFDIEPETKETSLLQMDDSKQLAERLLSITAGHPHLQEVQKQVTGYMITLECGENEKEILRAAYNMVQIFGILLCFLLL